MGWTNNFEIMDDEYFMKQAIKEAGKALAADEVPIGAIIVMKDTIIARGYNQVETLNDSTAHAEMIALTSAFNYLGSKYLPAATIYVTIEPCTMCCGALFWSKIGRLVYGAADPDHGAAGSASLHPKTGITGNVCAKQCLALLRDFFESKRK